VDQQLAHGLFGELAFLEYLDALEHGEDLHQE
jgi:hypothetical protein